MNVLQNSYDWRFAKKAAASPRAPGGVGAACDPGDPVAAFLKPVTKTSAPSSSLHQVR